MERLIDLSELWVVKDMEDSKIFDKDDVNDKNEEAKNFKIILKR